MSSGSWQEQETGCAASQERPVNTSRAAEFPNLLEASLADDHPDLFKYISNVQDLVSSLRLGERRAPDTLQGQALSGHSLTSHTAVNFVHRSSTLSLLRWNMIARVSDGESHVSPMQSTLRAPYHPLHSLSQSCTHQCIGNALHPGVLHA